MHFFDFTFVIRKNICKLMLEPSTIVGFIPKIIGHLGTPALWVGKKIRLGYFRLKNYAIKPLDEETAKKIAYSVLSGHIIRAVPYRNIDSKHTFIAVLRANTVSGYDRGIFILEQVGKTYRSIWESENIFCRDDLEALEVIDIDKDGVHEIAIIEESWGTGLGYKMLTVYSTVSKEISRITENYCLSSADKPFTPSIEIESNLDQQFKEKLEKYAVKRGFLEENEFCDLERPEYAEQRWHLENGDQEEDIKLFFYEGAVYHDESSITSELDTPEILWRAYFKGPLVGCIKTEKKWFIAYSSANRYNWITNLAIFGNFICFGLHCENILCFFSFEEKKLYRYKAYRNVKLPIIDTIKVTDSEIIINEESEMHDDLNWRLLKIPFSELDYLQNYYFEKEMLTDSDISLLDS